MNDFSEAKIKENCPHCDPTSFALKYPLEERDNFRVVCDVHPLIEGHILIIPKRHLSCIGEYPQVFFEEFVKLFEKFSKFLKQIYNSVSSFEHGKIGQTVFHSHIHLLPFDGIPSQIVPEGKENLTAFSDFSYLKKVYDKLGKYLYFSIGDKRWIVETKLAAPRFFRDRFAKALSAPQRGNWKLMDADEKIMLEANKEIVNLRKNWELFSKSLS